MFYSGLLTNEVYSILILFTCNKFYYYICLCDINGINIVKHSSYSKQFNLTAPRKWNAFMNVRISKDMYAEHTERVSLIPCRIS